MQVYAEDLQNAAWRTVALAEVPTKFQDLRLARNLDPQKPFAEKKEVTVLTTGQTLQVADMRTAELETYDSLARVFSLLSTLSSHPGPAPGSPGLPPMTDAPPPPGSPGLPPMTDVPPGLPDVDAGKANLAKFAWILQWPKLSEEEKRAKYSEFACHELNFFLARKDAPFFQKVVLPYLRNKKDRTFMDDYLLGNDLHHYLEPWAFAWLNAAERCLLAQRLPGEAALMARHERELWEMVTPDTAREDLLFETALRGRSLTEAELGDFAAGQVPARWRRDARRGGGSGGGGAIGSTGLFPVPRTPGAAAESRFAKSGAGKLTISGASGFAGGAVTAMPAPAVPAAPPVAQLAAPAETAKDAATQLGIQIEQNNLKELEIDQVLRERQQVRQFFRALGPTKEWAENNYYHLPMGEQGPLLVPVERLLARLRRLGW